MISHIFDSDSFKIMSLFSISPGSKFGRKQIQERVMLNNVPLDKALLRLVSSGVLKREGNFYSVDFRNDAAKEIIELSGKQYRELKSLPFGVYLTLLELSRAISVTKGAEAYLFGSYSKLVYSDKSDVDVAVLSTETLQKEPIFKLARALEKKYGKSIEIHFFAKKPFHKNRKDPLVKDILDNGIRLV